MIADIPTYINWIKLRIEVLLYNIFADDGRRHKGDYNESNI